MVENRPFVRPVFLALAVAAAVGLAIADWRAGVVIPIEAPGVVLGVAVVWLSRRYPGDRAYVREIVDDWPSPRQSIRFYWFEIGLIGGLALTALVAGFVLPESVVMGYFGYDSVAAFANAEGGDGPVTVGSILANNLFIAGYGLLTLGFGSASALVATMLLIGPLVKTLLPFVGWPFVAAGLVPHGVLEIPGFLLVSAGPMRFFVETVVATVFDRELRIAGLDRHTVTVVIIGLALLVAAAFVEVYVSGWLLEQLVPGLDIG